MISLIIKYTIIEAYKKHLFTLLVSAFIACIVLAYYAKSISIIEGDASFIYFYNGAIRLVAVSLLAWYCMIAQAQNQEKARLQMQLALPLSRLALCVGNLVAYYVLAFIVAIITVLPLVVMGDVVWFDWLLSFCLELCVLVTIAYLLSLLFTQATVTISLFTLIYVFARNAAEFTRHANEALKVDGHFFDFVSLWLIKITALLVPKLENYANSVILEVGLQLEQMIYLAVESLLYITLLFFIAVIELRKKRL